MRIKQLTAIALAVILSLYPVSIATACSVFAFESDSGVVLGANLDWYPIPGHVIVSPSGIEKKLLPWKGSWPSNRNEVSQVKWKSKHASITFTRYGRGFIESGMNDAGLVIDQASLYADYPPEDDRPGISCSQWMQYQLDNFATVEAVVENIDSLRPDGEGWHYLITDKTGVCTIVEYIDERPLIRFVEPEGHCVLTNASYEQALSHIPLDKRFGGDIDIASKNDSYGRFVRLGALMGNFDSQVHGPSINYAFDMLAAVAAEDTIRTVVYDITNGRVIWKTRKNAEQRWLDFKTVELSPNGPPRYIDVDTALTGNVAPFLKDFSYSENRELVKQVIELESTGKDISNLVRGRDISYEQVIELLASNPTP